jgi:hypothetical protein
VHEIERIVERPRPPAAQRPIETEPAIRQPLKPDRVEPQRPAERAVQPRHAEERLQPPHRPAASREFPHLAPAVLRPPSEAAPLTPRVTSVSAAPLQAPLPLAPMKIVRAAELPRTPPPEPVPPGPSVSAAAEAPKKEVETVREKILERRTERTEMIRERSITERIMAPPPGARSEHAVPVSAVAPSRPGREPRQTPPAALSAQRSVSVKIGRIEITARGRTKPVVRPARKAAPHSIDAGIRMIGGRG